MTLTHATAIAAGLAVGGHAVARSVRAHRLTVMLAATLATGRPVRLDGFGQGPSPHQLPLEVAAS